MRDILPYITLFIVVGGWIASFFKAKGMDETQQKQIDDKLRELHGIDDKQWKAIDDRKQWEGYHEKESSQRRLELELKIERVAGMTSTLGAKMDSIGEKLDTLIEELKHERKG